MCSLISNTKSLAATSHAENSETVISPGTRFTYKSLAKGSSVDVCGTKVDVLLDGSRLQHTAPGRVEMITHTSAELEIQCIISGLDDSSHINAPTLQRALAGHFGRLEREENEAFLRMRAVCDVQPGFHS